MYSNFFLNNQFQQESDGNGVPSLTLPSISEDDENLQEGETSPVSPNRSPLLQISGSPRHAKFNLRLVFTSPKGNNYVY